MKIRNNKAIEALTDEYEKSIIELINLIRNLSQSQIIEVIDFDTEDEDCISIQNVLSHVVQSGYTYVIEIRKWLGEEVEYIEKIKYSNSDEYISALQNMFDYTEKLFDDFPNIEISENDSNSKINTRWGQKYDVEQLLEHAIVHVLRHRRQIKNMVSKNL